VGGRLRFICITVKQHHLQYGTIATQAFKRQGGAPKVITPFNVSIEQQNIPVCIFFQCKDAISATPKKMNFYARIAGRPTTICFLKHR
jgi:hypothetical protein